MAECERERESETSPRSVRGNVYNDDSESVPACRKLLVHVTLVTNCCSLLSVSS